MDVYTAFMALFLVTFIVAIATLIIWLQNRDWKNNLVLWPVFFAFGIITFGVYLFVPVFGLGAEIIGTVLILLHTLLYRYILWKLHSVYFKPYLHCSVLVLLILIAVTFGFIPTLHEYSSVIILVGVLLYYGEATYLLFTKFLQEKNAVYLYFVVSFIPLLLYLFIRGFLFLLIGETLLQNTEYAIGAPILFAYMFLHIIVLVAIIYHNNANLIQSLHYEQANLQRTMIKLKDFAEKDELTTIFNRRYINNMIRTETLRLNRYGGDSSLILFDIDHFKDVNDKWGHDIGDMVLTTIATLVQDNVRTTDTFGRWGGEEFMILLPHTNLSQASLKAEQLRQLLEQHVMRHNIQITCSFGVSTKYAGESHKTWIKRADIGLYQAKEEGRNRVKECEHITLEDSALHEFTWTDEFLCNISIIDDAHIMLMNTIRELVKMSIPHDKMVIQLEAVLEATAKHFQEEEQEMRKYDFPLLVQHKHIHNRLIQDTSTIVEKFTNQPGSINLQSVLTVLEELIVEHLIQEDSKFFRYLETSSME